VVVFDRTAAVLHVSEELLASSRLLENFLTMLGSLPEIHGGVDVKFLASSILPNK
jgi:hypothetical protein